MAIRLVKSLERPAGSCEERCTGCLFS